MSSNTHAQVLGSTFERFRKHSGLTEEHLSQATVKAFLPPLRDVPVIRNIQDRTGCKLELAVLMAVRGAALKLQPVHFLIVDVTLRLHLIQQTIDRDPISSLPSDLYHSVLGRRRRALLRHWDSLLDLILPSDPVPHPTKPTETVLRTTTEPDAYRQLAEALLCITIADVDITQLLTSLPTPISDGLGAELHCPTLTSSSASPFAPVWAQLAQEVLRSKRVCLIGIAPRPLIAALRENWPSDDSTVPRPEVRYCTLAPRTVYQLAASDEGHCIYQQWNAALTGFRNILKLAANEAQGPDRFYHFAETIPSVTTTCLVQCEQDSERPAWLVCAAPGVPDDWLVVPLSSASPVDLIARLHTEPLRIRQVDCHCVDVDMEGQVQDFPQFQVTGLSPYGSPKTSGSILLPVAIAVLRAATPQGMEVVLKLRTPLTDNDDFGKLSLFSSRIQEEDLIRMLPATIPEMPSAEASLERIWLEFGSPDPFVIPERAFVLAAQREVFVSAHLDLPPERFTFRGTHLVSREDTGIQLGFAVFTVDLSRTRHLDEVGRALFANVDGLRRVRVAELYGGNYSLNRLLLARKEWLMEACFARK